MPSWDHDAPVTLDPLAKAAVVAAAVCIALALPMLGESAPVSGAAAVRAEIRAVFGPARAPLAIKVATCESRLKRTAVSRTGDYGAFQANYSAHHWLGETRAAFARRHFNLRYHVRWAYRLSRAGTNFYRAWRWSYSCWGRA